MDWEYMIHKQQYSGKILNNFLTWSTNVMNCAIKRGVSLAHLIYKISKADIVVKGPIGELKTAAVYTKDGWAKCTPPISTLKPEER